MVESRTMVRCPSGRVLFPHLITPNASYVGVLVFRTPALYQSALALKSHARVMLTGRREVKRLLDFLPPPRFMPHLPRFVWNSPRSTAKANKVGEG